MQNMFTGEHQAQIVIDTLRSEARRHEALKLARAGQPHRLPGASLLASIGDLRGRLTTATRRARAANRQPACQPGMAC